MENIVYFSNVSSLKNNNAYLKYFNLLPKFRQDQVNKLKTDQLKFRSVAAFTLLLKLLNDYKIEYNPDDFMISENGKPCLKNFPIHFSISHSNDYVVAAISESPIGVDVELIKQRDDLDRLSHYVFSLEEIDTFNAQEDKIHHFYETWCKKEAYLKCIGIGLNKPMQSINLLSSELEDYKFHTLVKDNYQFAICVKDDNPITQIEIKL